MNFAEMGRGEGGGVSALSAATIVPIEESTGTAVPQLIRN